MKVEGYDIEEMPVIDAIGIGYVSLVAYRGKFPRTRGNYFSLTANDNKHYEIANMWYENLKYLMDEGKVSFPLKIKVIDRGWAIVYDERVPDNYYTEISYRAPIKFWSLNRQAQRQLDIDTGKLKITKLESGMTVESRNIGIPAGPVVMPYVPVFLDEGITTKNDIDFGGTDDFEG